MVESTVTQLGRLETVRPKGGSMPEEVVRAEDVHKFFGSFEVLRGIDCSIKRGEVVVIIGPSGAGKSTFLRCINGLEMFQRGDICVGGVRLRDKSTDIHKVRSEVGMVFQRFNLYPHLRVLQNLGVIVREQRANRSRGNRDLKICGVQIGQ